MASLDGKVAFITGASSGIGAALARELARRGADVALLARRADRLEEVGASIEELGRRALRVVADVTTDDDLAMAASTTREQLGRIDIVVANAGFGVAGRVEKLSIDDYKRQFETNVYGVIRTVHATLDDLRASRGYLALLGSVSSYLALPKNSAYTMSKFAVRALAETLALELKRDGISVTHIAPGFVESEIRKVDNRGVFKPERKEPAPNWMIMPTDTAAKKMATAILRRKAELVLSTYGKLAVAGSRHTPTFFNALAKSVLK